MKKLLLPFLLIVSLSCFAGTAFYKEYDAQCHYKQQNQIVFEGACNIKFSVGTGVNDPVFYVATLSNAKVITFDAYRKGKAVFENSIPAKIKYQGDTIVVNVKGGDIFTLTGKAPN